MFVTSEILGAPDPHVGVINRIVWRSASDRKCRLRHCGNRLLPMGAAMNERASERANEWARFVAARSAPGIRQNRVRSSVAHRVRNLPPPFDKYAKSHSSHACSLLPPVFLSLSLFLGECGLSTTMAGWHAIPMNSHSRIRKSRY